MLSMLKNLMFRFKKSSLTSEEFLAKVKFLINWDRNEYNEPYCYLRILIPAYKDLHGDLVINDCFLDRDTKILGDALSKYWGKLYYPKGLMHAPAPYRVAFIQFCGENVHVLKAKVEQTIKEEKEKLYNVVLKNKNKILEILPDDTDK